MVFLIAVAVPDMISLLKQLNTSPGMQLLTWKLLFAHYQLAKVARNSFLSVKKVSNTPSLSCLRGISALQPLCYNLVHRDLDHFSLLQDIILAHYIDDIMLIRPTEQEVANY